MGLGLLAALGFGIFFAGMGAAASAGALVAVALSRLSAITLVLVAAAVRAPRTRLARDQLAPLAAVGALDALGNVLFAVALTSRYTGMVSVLASLYPVSTILLARLVLGEPTTGLQRLGAAACCAGVVGMVTLSA